MAATSTSANAANGGETMAANREIRWNNQTWGRVGVVHLANAPFPDASRDNGFTTDDGQTFPRAGHYDDDSVGFVVPPGYKPCPSVRFVVIFHGHGTNVTQFITTYGVGKAFADAKPGAILVVPQGPKDAFDSGGGKMETPGGFKRMMEELLDRLKEGGVAPPNATIGDLIVGGYSGGYRPVAFVLRQGGMTDRVREVWLFDAAYDFQDDLAGPFLAPDSKTILRALFTDHLMPEHLRIMSAICRAGHRIDVVRDDDLVSPSTNAASSQPPSTSKPEPVPASPESASPQPPTPAFQESQLAALLREDPLLFIHTSLPHDAVAFTKRFLGVFVRESKTVGPAAAPPGEK